MTTLSVEAAKAGMSAEAVGVDLVHIPSFAAQLHIPGTRFGQVFADSEWEYCRARGQANGSDTPNEDCLAVRWAAKEAFVKAWSGLLFGCPPAMEEEGFPWADIVVAHDEWKRPYLRFYGRIASEITALEQALEVRLAWNLSLSHDGDMAIAYVHVRAHLRN